MEELQGLWRWASSLTFISVIWTHILWIAQLPWDQKILEGGKVFLQIVGAFEVIKFVYRLIMRRRAHMEEKIDSLEKDLKYEKEDHAKLKEQHNALGEELKATKEKLPEAALAAADKDLRHGNEDPANWRLEKWLEENAAAVEQIALRTAKYHISRSVPDPGEHLRKAKDRLTLARGVAPESEEARELSFDFDNVNASLQQQFFSADGEQIAWNSGMKERLEKEKGEGLLPVIQTLAAIREHLRQKGYWRILPVFAERTSALAFAGGKPLERWWFNAEWRAAQAISLAGRFPEALERIESLLRRGARFMPPKDEDVLTARFYKANFLMVCSRNGEALAELDGLLPIRTEVSGALASDTLATRELRTRVLVRMGLYRQAIDELNELRPLRLSVSGPRDENTFSLMFARADALLCLGRLGEAAAELQELIALESQCRDPSHPGLLYTRSLNARALGDLGRYDACLSELSDLIPLLTANSGPRHPETLGAMFRKAQVLAELSRNTEAMKELETLLPQSIEVTGQGSELTLHARYLRAWLYKLAGRSEEAAHDMSEIAALAARSLGEEHPLTLQARFHEIILAAPLRKTDNDDFELRRLIDKIEANGTIALRMRADLAGFLYSRGRFREARIEIDAALARFDKATAPSNALLGFAKNLRELIDEKLDEGDQGS
jgi:hypothetical protein